MVGLLSFGLNGRSVRLTSSTAEYWGTEAFEGVTGGRNDPGVVVACDGGMSGV